MSASTAPLVLLVDDDPAVGSVLSALLRQAGMQCQYVTSAVAALEVVDSRPFDVVLSDVRMPGTDGLTLLDMLVVRHPDLPVVLLTAHGTVPMAVEAMKRGAADFLMKPFDRQEILFVLSKVMAVRPRTPGCRSVDVGAPSPLIGSSAAMQEMDALITQAASSPATVLIRGASGTGKELVARAIHHRSPRRDAPLVVLHCAALPDNLLESELFGYEKGAFTGAVNRKPGRIELAHGGTLFLDEIGDISAATQVKLLRILQERQLERLGGTQTVRVDVRFVAATHRDLEQMVAAGSFREDLFYRINVIPLWIPPLRERPSDVVELARHFVTVLGRVNGRPGCQFAPEALEYMAAQCWPGNVRQLENFVERMVVLSNTATLGVDAVKKELERSVDPARRLGGAATPVPALPPTADGAPPPGLDLEERLRRSEREALENALVHARDNRTLAARLLGVSRRTLYDKLEEHGLLKRAPSI